jgi:hypothetical protein
MRRRVFVVHAHVLFAVDQHHGHLHVAGVEDGELASMASRSVRGSPKMRSSALRPSSDAAVSVR